MVIYSSTHRKLGQGIANSDSDGLYFFVPTLGLIFIQALFASWSRSEPLYKYLVHDYLIFGVWILALWGVIKKYRITKCAVLLITALHALFIEGVIFLPIGFLIAPMTVLFYWLMIYPALMVIQIKYSISEDQQNERSSKTKNILIAFIVPLISILVAQAIAILLQSIYPFLFSEYDF